MVPGGVIERYLFAIVALVLIAGFVLDAWLLLFSGGDPARLVIVIALQGLVSVAAIGLLWAWFEVRVRRPLRTLEDDVGIMLRGNPAHSAEPPEGHALGGLPAAINALAREHVRARHDTAKAMDSARASSERRRTRLEAILRDLSEGVVVCTLQHRVVLFNERAAELLGDDGRIGVGRPLTALLQPGPLRATLARLERREYDSSDVAEMRCRRVSSSGSLRGRMRLVVEQDGTTSGYVLSLDSDTPGEDTSLPAQRTVDVLERPPFYDFDLFERVENQDLLASPMRELDYVVFDTETTGLRPSEGDEIVQVGAVRLVRGRLHASETFDQLVNPGRPIPRASTRIHGISDEMVAGALPARVVLARFHEFVEGAVLVAHNAAFDLKFLQLKEAEAGVRFDNPVLDTLLLSVVLQPAHVTHTLDAIAYRFGVDTHDRHTALGDAMTTAEVFVKMIEALESQGIHTLGEALAASDRVFEIRRLQEEI